MIRTIYRTARVAAVVGLSASAAWGSTLAGDQIQVDLADIHIASPTVGPGYDLTFGAWQMDFNAGLLGNQFVFYDNGGYFSNRSSLTLSDLNFSDGSILTGFILGSSSLSNLSTTVSGTSVTFNFDPQGYGPNSGPAISGTFVTSPVSAVPLPAAGLLLSSAFLGLGLARRRRPA